MTASSTKRSDDRQRKMKAIATTANVTAIADRRSKMKRLPAQNESDCDGRQRDSDRRPPTQNESDRDDRHGNWQMTGDARRKHNDDGFFTTHRWGRGCRSKQTSPRDVLSRNLTPGSRCETSHRQPSKANKRAQRCLRGHASTARLREPALHSMAMSIQTSRKDFAIHGCRL